MISIDRPLAIAADGFGFTEALRWKDSRIFFSDLFLGQVWWLDEQGNQETLLEVDDIPSGLGFLPDGDLLIVLMESARIVRLGPTGHLSDYADLSPFAVGPNDMIVDLSGQVYVGQLGFDHRTDKRSSTSLLLITPDGDVSEVAQNLWGPNGMVLSHQGRRLYVSESESDKVTMYDRDTSGRLSNPKVAVQLPHAHRPDGICRDNDGGLWVSVPFAMAPEAAPRHFGPGIIRFGADGAMTHLIPAPEGRRFVDCTFGGSGLDKLFVCSVTTSSRRRGRVDRAARIEYLTVGFTGAEDF